MAQNLKQMAEDIIAGKRWERKDDVSFLLEADLTELCEAANEIRKRLCGNKVDLCSIINGRSGSCSENCKFCAQSGHHNTGVETYSFLDKDKILEDAKMHEKEGVHYYSIVTAGRTLGADFEKAREAYQLIHEQCPELHICASHGLLSSDELKQLKEAGVTRCHENIETSRRNFPNICTTHTYEDKIAAIRRAQEAGLVVCSGGIIGMGEDWEDRLDMAFSLAELSITSIPINILSPIPGTPFAEVPPISKEDILRTIAIFRILNPTALIRIAAGRSRFADGGRELFETGVNATITGNMLTTVGNTISEDKAMLTDMGFTI